MKKEVISNSQFTILVVMFNIGSSTLIAPSLVAIEAKRDAWLSIILATLCGAILAKLMSILAGRYPEGTLIDINEQVLGRWIGKLVSALFFFYFLIMTAALLRIVGDFLTTLIMPETPIQAIEIAFCLTVVMGVRLGLEAFARTTEILMPWVLLFFLLLVLALIPEFKWSNLVPVLENGILPAIRGAIPLLGIPYLDLVVFMMVAPFVTHPTQLSRGMIKGVFVGGLVLGTLSTLSILALGADLTSRLNYPTYELAQKVNIGEFIQRIEIIGGGIMFISIFAKIAISFYAMTASLAQIVELKHYKPLTYPLGMLVIALSLLISPNIVYFQRFALESWTPFCMVFGLILPLFLLFTDMAKRRLKKSARSG